MRRSLARRPHFNQLVVGLSALLTVVLGPSGGALGGSKEVFKELHEMRRGYADRVVAMIQRSDDEQDANPISLLIIAEQIVQRDPETAVALLFLGRLRLGYDVGRCRERSSEASFTVALMLTPKVAGYLRDNPGISPIAIDRALRWEAGFDETGFPAHSLAKSVCGEHFARPARGQPPVWLVDPVEWPGVRQRVRETIQKAALAVGQPAFDYPPATRTLHQKRISVRDPLRLSWLNDTDLVYDDIVPSSESQRPLPERALFAWNGNDAPRQVAMLGKLPVWCAAGNRISYIVESVVTGKDKESTFTQRYREGDLHRQQEKTFTVRRSDARHVERTNRFTCARDPDDRLAPNRRLLLEADGYLESVPDHGSMTWHRPSASPVDIPIALGLALHSMSECISRYDDGYFLWRCNGAGPPPPKGGCAPAVYLRQGGEVEKICLPAASEFPFGYASVLPSRIGLTFGVFTRSHHSGTKPGGLYRRTDRGFRKAG